MTDRSNVAAHIAYDDLREWLVEAERLGEVRTVRGASWQEDIGLAAEAILRAENGPCVVFDDVPAMLTDHIARELYDLEADEVMGASVHNAPTGSEIPALGTAAAA